MRSTDVVIFGGTPPYNVVNANGVIAVTPPVVTQSGGSFRAQTVSSACFTDAPITITDAAGRTIIVRITNQEGTQPAPAPAVQLSPASITLGCGQSGSFVINGGTPPFSAGSSNPLVTAAPPVNRTVTVTRTGPAGPGTGNDQCDDLRDGRRHRRHGHGSRPRDLPLRQPLLHCSIGATGTPGCPNYRLHRTAS